MTTVSLPGYVSVYLTSGGDETVRFTLSNVKATALEQDIYDVVSAIAGLLLYPVEEILYHQKSNLNA